MKFHHCWPTLENPFSFPLKNPLSTFHTTEKILPTPMFRAKTKQDVTKMWILNVFELVREHCFRSACSPQRNVDQPLWKLWWSNTPTSNYWKMTSSMTSDAAAWSIQSWGNNQVTRGNCAMSDDWLSWLFSHYAERRSLSRVSRPETRWLCLP